MPALVGSGDWDDGSLLQAVSGCRCLVHHAGGSQPLASVRIQVHRVNVAEATGAVLEGREHRRIEMRRHGASVAHGDDV